MPSISVPTAIIGASVLGAGTAIYGASQQSSAAKKAAAAQSAAANHATDVQMDMFGQSKEQLQPFITGGQSAYGTLNDLLGVGGSGNSSQMQDTLNNLPGYQFTLNQGLKSVQNSAAARGLGVSGAALKGATNYTTGLANSQYGNYVGQLQSSANTGETAANALAGYGVQTGGNIGGNIVGAGNAAAGSYIASGNAAANAANGIANSGNNLSQYYMLNNILKSTQQPASGGGDLAGANQLIDQYASNW